ncbi:MAG: DNA-cytosine methyltransferase [Candidatus Frackibacter sp. T328-2]|nr:MAG: DNA-cytosine methyltransferase [Candidatus Frackibacter sp. T328-2]
MINKMKGGQIVSKYKVVSLFSGCGGLDLGFKNAGFEIIWANEFDSKIWETYEYNHPGTGLDKRSIVDIDSSEIPDADGIIGGPPCQAWSLAGAMGGIEDNRGKLFYEYIRILRDKKPKFFLAENVPGIVSKTHIEEFMKIKERLGKLGYEVTFKKVNSVNYGVPQTRKRVFIIGYRKDLEMEFEFPLATHAKKSSNKVVTINEVKPIKNLRDAIGDLPEPIPAKDKNYTNGEELEINAHEYHVGSFSSRFMSRNRRRGWEEPAYTVEASGRHAKIHPSAPPMIKVEKDKWKFEAEYEDEYRRFSVRESARIQTFPDSFRFFYEKLNDGYKMIGNAVPVKLAEALANKIFEDFNCIVDFSKNEVSCG